MKSTGCMLSCWAVALTSPAIHSSFSRDTPHRPYRWLSLSVFSADTRNLVESQRRKAAMIMMMMSPRRLSLSSSVGCRTRAFSNPVDCIVRRSFVLPAFLDAALAFVSSSCRLSSAFSNLFGQLLDHLMHSGHVRIVQMMRVWRKVFSKKMKCQL